jgi:hypothetical protein
MILLMIVSWWRERVQASRHERALPGRCAAYAEAVPDDESLFTTAHFNGHLSVLLRASRIGELARGEVAEMVQDAWLSRASARRAAAWLNAHPPT